MSDEGERSFVVCRCKGRLNNLYRQTRRLLRRCGYLARCISPEQVCPKIDLPVVVNVKKPVLPVAVCRRQREERAFLFCYFPCRQMESQRGRDSREMATDQRDAAAVTRQ